MAKRKLIKAREGVYGRQATPEEQERFRLFAIKWAEIEKNHAARAAEIVNKCAEFYDKHGRFPTGSELFSEGNT